MNGKVIRVIGSLLIVFSMFACKVENVNADYPTKIVYFSNLSTVNANQYKPGMYTGKSYAMTGIIANNIVYVRAYDFVRAFGVDYVLQDLGSTVKLIIYGNSSPQVYFYSNSNTYGIYQSYSVSLQMNEIWRQGHLMTDGTVTQSSSRTYYHNSSNGLPFIYYDGGQYIPAKIAALSLGALVYYESLHYDVIYDYRVNSIGSPYYDGNQYLTGGKWINNWYNEGSNYLAPHFKINEIWSKTTSDLNYLYQLKVSVNQLSVAELVRHYYRNDMSLGIDPGFRGWNQNYNLAGAAKLSWHTRGRAWDSDGIPSSVQEAVQIDMAINDFGDSLWPSPPPANYSIYRSVKSNYQEISLGNEIEVGTSWLHLQTDADPNATSHAVLP